MIDICRPNYEKLKPHVNSRRKIRIERRRLSTPCLNGYLVGLSTCLGMMHCFDDFEPDGYTIFRLEDIESIRCSEYERHWDYMLREEGLLEGLDRHFSIQLSSMEAALSSSAQQAGMLIVECEDGEDDSEDFYIGNLVSVGEKSIRFDNFDALGNWDDRSEVIQTSEITIVQFETTYLKRFSKYLRGMPASQRNVEQRQS